MGKKKRRDKQTSSGQRRSVAKRWTKLARREYVGSPQEVMNKLEAYNAGKNVLLTVLNPNKKKKEKELYIKINAKDYWRNA